MNRSLRLMLAVMAALLLLAGGSYSQAAPLSQGPVPGQPAGQEGASPAAGPFLAEPIPGGPGFRSISALQFKPWHPSTLWEYYYLDLYNPGTGWGSYSAALTLPDHVQLTQVVVHYYDNDGANDLLVRLWRGNQVGGWDLMADTPSSGEVDAYRSAVNSSIGFSLVDQQNYSYVLEVQLPPSGLNLRLTGVRIDYAYTSALPVISKP